MSTTQTQIIDGKQIAANVRAELKEKLEAKLAQDSSLRAPGLAVIIVGDDPASHYYVGSKQKACASVGIESFKTVLPENAAKDDVLTTIKKYNEDSNVDGILLQLPLPEAICEHTREIVNSISPAKDADGLTSINLGNLLSKDPNTVYPCTPKGCMELIKRYKIETQGKRALVIGRSELVGKPISLMLNNANATVTMAHSRTADLAAEVAKADIVVAAIGHQEFIKGDWIKPGAAVIDVGINAAEVDGVRKLFGDVEFEAAAAKASAITPVPGGVGPMTVAMLLSNTYELYLRNNT